MNEKNITLRNIDDVKAFFANNKVPYYFISASNFNLINLHDWISSWLNINFIDCYDSKHKATLIPFYDVSPLFTSSEEINAYLLGHKEIVARIEKDRENLPEGTPNSRAIFLFFDPELEKVCEQLQLDICLPPNELVKEVDNKIVTTEIGNLAGVPSVPNVLSKVDSYAHLCTLAEKNGLGENLVVQTAYGDSGKTTFFVSNDIEYNKVAGKIECEEKVKVMKRIRCGGTAIEGCVTRCGTFVGPLLTELIGFPELTPYPGGWCGNELYPESFSPELRKKAHELTERLGGELWKRGYRGYFEVDYLIDLDTDDLYLGELNPRITGISAMTNSSNFCSETVPLFLFHLLEYSDCKLKLDTSEFNRNSLEQGAKGMSGQLIFKYSEPELNILEDAPVSGVYKFDGQKLHLIEAGCDRRKALAPDEGFLLRIMEKGEYVYKGADLGILFLNIKLKDVELKLTPKASKWLKGLKDLFPTRALTDEEERLVERFQKPTELLKGHGSTSNENST